MKNLNHAELIQSGGAIYERMAYFTAGGICVGAVMHIYHEKTAKREVPFFDQVMNKLGDAQDYLKGKADEYLPETKDSLIKFHDKLFGSND